MDPEPGSTKQLISGQDTWSARCVETRTPGAASGPGKRAGREASTAPRSDSTVDSAGTGGLLAQVEGRSAAVVTAWLADQPAEWREQITHVTTDLSASYAKAVRDGLPYAVLVADRFHVVHLANGMLTAVRQRVVHEAEGRRGRKIDPAWQVRRRLLTAHERLRPETFTKMWNVLVDTGDAGIEILGAYVVKEDLRALLALSGTNPDRAVIRERLFTFYNRAAASTSPEVHRLASTVEAWWPAIEAAIITDYSNDQVSHCTSS
jgi:transposase